MIDRAPYRVAASALRAADGGRQSRWWACLGVWDVLRIVEADEQGLVEMSGSEFCAIYGLSRSAWREWLRLLVTAELVTPLPRHEGFLVDQLDTEITTGQRVAIDPVAYRVAVVHLQRVAEEAQSRRWWMALGCWGLLRTVDAAPGSRILPYSTEELASMWEVDKRTMAGWFRLLAEANFVEPLPDGAVGWRMALLRSSTHNRSRQRNL